MKIDHIITQTRRDYRADMVCEHCGHHQIDNYGYDDANYHHNVIPNMKCESCGKKAPSDYRPLTTKYPEGQAV